MNELKKGISYYVMVDYDGTLCFDNEISWKNKIYIKRAQKKGYKFILNTGRSRGNVPAKALKINWDYIICGANYIEKNGEVLYRNEIPFSSLEKAFRVAKNIECSIDFEGEKTSIQVNKEQLKNISEKNFLLLCQELKEKIKDNPITKVSFWKGTDTRIDEKLKDLTIIHHKNYFEAFLKGCDKGTIVDKFIELENVDKNNLIGIGDSPNDIAMMERCGYKVAMKLADKQLADICDEVTKRSTTGVGDFIKKLIKL